MARLAVAGLRHERLRTSLGVLGIAIAVLAVTLLAGGGMGVLAFGEAQFEAADRDLWATGGPVGITPAGGGGIENTVHDAHGVAAEIEAHEDVDSAVPLLFQRVYVSPDATEFDSMIATGVPGGGSAISITEGEGFSRETDHYANGTYEGNLSHEVLIDEQTAARYELSVGDTIHVGGTLSDARDHEFEIVGISPTFSQFLGTPTVTVILSELQTVTGTTGTDPATMLAITVEEGAEPEAVQQDLEHQHPDLEINTNREQLEGILAQQATIVVGAGVLVVLAVIAGAGLATTLQAAYVYQHRRELGTLLAIGVSRRTLVGVVVSRGLVVGVAGWLLGVGLAVPLSIVTNRLVEFVTGYPDLVRLTPLAIGGAAVVAVGIGVIAAAIAAWRLPAGLT